jgi:transcriptional regulator with XRE-family HTH domain
MAGDGRPEMAAKRVGETIARLRTSRNWSRAKLISRIYDQKEEDTNDGPDDILSESKLARLESGRAVKVPRKMIEDICQALNCTDTERAEILLAADRNVFADEEVEVGPEAYVLNYLALRLRNDAAEILAGIVGERDYTDLTAEEVNELCIEAMKLVIRRLSKQA